MAININIEANIHVHDGDAKQLSRIEKKLDAVEKSIEALGFDTERIKQMRETLEIQKSILETAAEEAAAAKEQ